VKKAVIFLGIWFLSKEFSVKKQNTTNCFERVHIEYITVKVGDGLETTE
jgi:hypothetical protein